MNLFFKKKIIKTQPHIGEMPRITSGASFASRIRATCAINSTEKKAQFFTLKRNIRPELEQKGPHNASYLDAAHVQLAGILPSSVCHLIGRESFDFFFTTILSNV